VRPPEETVTEQEASLHREAGRRVTGLLTATTTEGETALVTVVSPVLAKEAVAEVTANRSISNFFIGKEGSKVSFVHSTLADGVKPTL
jgi:hypothetical protein